MIVALVKKEISGFFSNPISLLSIGILVIVAFLFLWIFPESSYVTYGLGSPDLYFTFLAYLFLFIVPIFSVGFLAGEFQQGTEVLLRSLGLDWKHVIIAKFLSALVVIFMILILSSIHLFVVSDISFSSTLSLGQILSGFAGLVGVGACYAALSIMVTSFVEQTSLSILLAIILCFAFYTGLNIISQLPVFDGNPSLILDRLSLSYHTDQLGRGILRLATLLYFPTLITWSLWISSIKLNAKQV